MFKLKYLYNKKYVSTQRITDPENYADLASEHNERLMTTAQGISNNVADLDQCNNQIERIHKDMREKLDSSAKSELMDADNKQTENMANLRKELDQVEQAVNSGIAELLVKQDMIQSEISHSNHIKNVLENSGVSAPEGKSELYNSLQETRERLIETNSLLTEEQTENLSAYYQFSHRVFGPLIDSSGPTGTLGEPTSETSSADEGDGAHSNRQGSLIDDFADTSTEQPSHMDPED